MPKNPTDVPVVRDLRVEKNKKNTDGRVAFAMVLGPGGMD